MIKSILLNFLIFSTVLLADKPSNSHFWYSLETTADPNKIWEIWVDVPNWKNWDTGLKDATLENTFSLNSKGKIISLEDRESKFEIIELVEGESYTFKTRLPLGSLNVKRYLTQKNGKTTFTHEVWFSGFSKYIFSSIYGRKFRQMLPEVLNNIKTIAEEK